MQDSTTTQTDQEAAVRDRYSEASKVREAALCCPVDYNKKYLEIIPKEVLERDYGCGDPSKYVKSGETVLDLGSGGGKICFIASQVVGAEGKVIGVDLNDDMLKLARDSSYTVADQLGYSNTSFLKGRIQDLSLDRDKLADWIRENPVEDDQGLQKLEEETRRLRREEPMVGTSSINVVVSNCVLNLVNSQQKPELFREIFRVLKPGGRAVISDIVASTVVPEHLQQDPELWSGCISGALEEREFIQAFTEAGFTGVQVLELQDEAWQTVEGIEFRSMTLVAYKGQTAPACLDHLDAAIYLGPFSKVEDDDGHVFIRGERSAVCRKTFEQLTRAPYQEHFIGISGPDDLERAATFKDEKGEVRRREPVVGARQQISCKPSSGCC